ncbi:MAG: SDR family oxidoreductase [Pseudomonadales bacterium]|nr:SDR family oxidoreductase [Pseudomonadales bacterium]
MLMQGKVVIISGIGPGLGIELALLAAREGAEAVVLAARTASKLADAAKQIADLNLGTKTLEVVTDIAKAEDCKNLVASTCAAFGRVDALVNSAYIPGKFSNWDKWDFDDWRKTLDVNLFGSLMLSREAARVMKDQPHRGAIVMVNSMVTRKTPGVQGGYATSKGALATATRALADDLAPYGIRVNSCLMGWMWGASVKKYVDGMVAATGATPEAVKQDIIKNIPMGFIPTDADCAKGCLFLVSDYAKVITGAALDINGGEYMPAG